MKLKIRKTVENVNFNEKGEQIENDFFDDKKKKDEEGGAASAEKEKKDEGVTPKDSASPKINSLIEVSKTLPAVATGNSQGGKVSAPPDENLRKGVVVSNRPDSSIAIDNGSPLKDGENNRRGEILAKTIPFLGAVLVLLVLAGGYLGLEARDTYLTKIPLAQVMKGDAQAVLSVNSDVEFEQYKYLDDNLRKFPGYKALEKKLDPTGEGKTVSQAFQDELAAKNLSFNDDIKPVIGENTLIVIPVLTPLTNKFQKFVFDHGKQAKNALRKMELEGKVADARKSLTEGDITGAGKIKVLGLTSDFYTNSMALEEVESEPVDFIIGAEIKSLKEARRVLEKLKADKSKYEISEMKFKGYLYYKLTQKGDGTEGEANKLVNIKDTYHALIGQNWIMATKEADLKEMLSARKSDHLLSKLAFWKKQENPMITLSNNESYNTTKKNLAFQSQDGFASFYFKTDLSSLVPPEYPENQDQKFFKPQEKDFIAGVLLRATPEGIVSRTSTNFIPGLVLKVESEGMGSESTTKQMNFSGFENMPIEKGLIEQMPSKADGRWTDLYLEIVGLKNLYYSMKKNLLTDEGHKMSDEAGDQIKQQIGFDPEADFIDHFNGNCAIAGFTSAGMSPQGAFIAEVDNKEAMLESMQKIVEIIRGIEMMPYKYAINPNVVASDSAQVRIKEIEEKVRLIEEAQFSQVQTDAGLIYSYQIPSIDEISFNVAFSDNKMVLATSQSVVVDLIKDFGDGNTPKLVDVNNFQNVVKNIYPEGYSKMLITPVGIFNGINYYIEKMEANFGIQKDDANKEMISAIGTILRTISSISAIETVSPVTEGDVANKSAVFVEIKEVSPEEKEYAEQILEKY